MTRRARMATTMVRKGWLNHGPGPDRQRGRENFVPLSWPQTLDLAARECAVSMRSITVRRSSGVPADGPARVRFHHAQSQVYRFLNVLGGYVKPVNAYSSAAAVILLHNIGYQEAAGRENVRWHELATLTDVVLAFGGQSERADA